jgi:hypothetical protein
MFIGIRGEQASINQNKDLTNLPPILYNVIMTPTKNQIIAGQPVYTKTENSVEVMGCAALFWGRKEHRL